MDLATGPVRSPMPWARSNTGAPDRRQGLQGRKPKRRRGLTRQDRSAPKFPDLLHRDFTAAAPNVKCCGDITEIPTDEGKLYLASVLDLHSRRLLASATSEHPDAGLACDAIKMATTARGGRAAIDGVIFHTDRGSTYTATSFTRLCRRPGVSQPMGRVGSCFDNAAAEAFLLDPRARGPVPAPLHHQSSGAPGRVALVPGLLQQPTPTQLRRLDVAHPIRETRCRPTGRSIRKAFTIRGEARPAERCISGACDG